MELEARNISSGYGSIEVLHSVSIKTIISGIIGIIGPNGSGKSTLLKTIVGLIKPKNGKIILNGENVTGFDPDKLLRKGLAMVPQGRTVFPEMTVLENMEMGAYTLSKKLFIERLDQVYKLLPILKKREDQFAGTLSGGEQTMLCIGRALVVNPKILLLDEPSLGLAPKLVSMVYNWIEEIKGSGRTLIIVEQNVRKILEVADYIHILDMGKNTFNGPPEDFLEDGKLTKLYLGGR